MKHPYLKKAALAFVLMLACIALQAQQTAHKFAIEMNYLLYLPDGYESDTITRWPLMVFLHGAGETGTDVEKLKVHGPPKLIEQGKKFPFIVLSLQTPKYGWRPDNVMDIVGTIASEYRVDFDRMYLTGLSMGGFGTWAVAQKYPNVFAAIVPICGGGETGNIWALENIPVWCFHGAKDDVVDISMSQKMINALKPYNPDVKFTIYPEANHDSWTETYNNDEVYDWMLSHKRFRYTQVPVEQDLLDKYAGTYVAADNDSVQFSVQGNELSTLNARKRPISLKAASDKLFFTYAEMYDHIIFNRDAGNNVLGFTLFTATEKKDYLKK